MGSLPGQEAGTGTDDLRTFAATATLGDRLGARIAAALDRFKADDANARRRLLTKRAFVREQEKAGPSSDKAKAAMPHLLRAEAGRRSAACPLREAERQAKAAEAQRRADQAAADKEPRTLPLRERSPRQQTNRSVAPRPPKRIRRRRPWKLNALRRKKSARPISLRRKRFPGRAGKTQPVVAKGSAGTGLDI